jgi:hypothetical protein
VLSRLLAHAAGLLQSAGRGRRNRAANINQRVLFPLVHTDSAESLIRRALPELPWPSQPLLALPTRVHRRYLTVPLEYAAGFTLLMLLLPGWWALLAILPAPLGVVLAVARAREARWRVDDQSWHCGEATTAKHGSRASRWFTTEFSGRVRRGKPGRVAGFRCGSPGWGAGTDTWLTRDALLPHTVGRAGAHDQPSLTPRRSRVGGRANDTHLRPAVGIP